MFEKNVKIAGLCGQLRLSGDGKRAYYLRNETPDGEKTIPSVSLCEKRIGGGVKRLVEVKEFHSIDEAN